MRLVLSILLCLAGSSYALAQAPGASESGPFLDVPFASLHLRNQTVPPAYPPLARVAKVQGTVTVRITVDPRGVVGQAEALAGPMLLRPAAEALCKQWSFEPVVIDGKPVSIRSELNIPFRLMDVPALEAETRGVRSVLELEIPSSALTVPTDAEALRAEARAGLLQAGLVLVEPSEADQARDYQVRLRIQALQLPDGIYLQIITARFSLLADRDLTADETGKPIRICTASHFLGQRGASGFPESLIQTVRRTLRDLAAPPLPLVRKAVGMASAGAAAGGALAGAAEPAKHLPVDFDFSQIRIKRQPPAPRYPVYAKQHRIQGTVVVELTIDPSGRAAHVEALEGPNELLLTAMSYALDWEFEPARLNGLPQWARFKLTMPFRLR